MSRHKADMLNWLRRRQRNRQDAIGDLARDLGQDKASPRRGGLRALLRYLDSIRADACARWAAQDAAREWKARP